MVQSVDINCDVGEGINNEDELMPYISSCNIACGAHAGNDDIIIRTIQLALEHHVKIGAHPSFPDSKNFGREIMDISSLKLQQSLENQIRLIKYHTNELGAVLHHVKPHGALYNLAAKDSKTAQIIINAVKNTAKDVVLYVPYKSVIAKLAKKNEIKIKNEAFADRNYNSDLTLVSRKEKNAVLIDKHKVLDHLLKMMQEKKVISVDGVVVKMEADTYCFHGDNPKSIELLKFVTKELPKNSIKID